MSLSKAVVRHARATGYDPPSRFLALESADERNLLARPDDLSGRREDGLNVDVLSDLLRTVRLGGGVFFDVRAVAPWVAAAPHSAHLAASLRPGTEHVIPYHVVIEGECYAGLLDEDKVHMRTGDVIVLPHGDPHMLADDPDRPAVPDPGQYGVLRNVELPLHVDVGPGGRASVRLVCGFLACDARPFNPLLETLPPVIHHRAGSAPDAPWLRHFLDVAVAESESKRAGGGAVLARLSELMFVEVLRHYLDTLPEGRPGWLAGLRDPMIARALSLLHAQPGDAWSLDRLADEVAASRSVLAERFTQIVGVPVMHYLARWRMQVAAGRLVEGNAKIAEIALEVGYDSEAAFSRAFKKLVGTSPGAWRRRKKGAAWPIRPASATDPRSG